MNVLDRSLRLTERDGQPISVTPLSGGAIGGTFDALGRLVETASGTTYTQFVYSPAGTKVAVVRSGSLVKGSVPLPGGETAIYNANGLNFLRHTDYLGSSRLGTTWAHAVYSKEAYAPFGETYDEAGTADRSFTGQDQDTVTGSGGTGVYDFLYRKHDPSAGRWLSPDPAGWAAVNLTNPQTLNRYAYVVNSPHLLTDQKGLDCAWQTDGGYVMVSDGDCPTSGEGANGYYVDCDGCLYNASSGYIDPSTGNAYFLNANGNLIDQDTIKGFTDADPSFYITTMTVSAESDSLSVTYTGLGYIAPNNGQVPVNGRWTYGNHCAAGGMGTDINSTDAACHAHDDCYDAIHLTADQYRSGNLTPAQAQGAAACNQQLCNSVLNVNRGSGIPFSQRWAGAEIILFFSLTGPKGAQCQGF